MASDNLPPLIRNQGQVKERILNGNPSAAETFIFYQKCYSIYERKILCCRLMCLQNLLLLKLD